MIISVAPQYMPTKDMPTPKTAAPAFDHECALRGALGPPGVGVAVIGMYSEEELDRNIEWVRRWQPLTAEKEAQLLEEGRRIARSLGEHHGDLV